MLINSEGIVLRQKKIANNRRMITLFTKKYGKISAGTGINERSKGKAALALRPFTYANYNIYKGRGYYNIDGAEVLESYYSIGEDIDCFMIASKLLSYIESILPENQTQPRLFEFAVDCLKSFSQASGNYNTLLYAFIVRSFVLLGIMPELNQCVNCGKSLADLRSEDGGKARFFSVSGGGILCSDCSKKASKEEVALLFEQDFDIVEVLQYFMKNSFSLFEKVSLKPEVSIEMQKILSSYLKYYLDSNLLEKNMKF